MADADKIYVTAKSTTIKQKNNIIKTKAFSNKKTSRHHNQHQKVKTNEKLERNIETRKNNNNKKVNMAAIFLSPLVAVGI